MPGSGLVRSARAKADTSKFGVPPTRSFCTIQDMVELAAVVAALARNGNKVPMRTSGYFEISWRLKSRISGV